MKKYILFILFSLPLLSFTQTVNLMPDATWRDEKDHSWIAHGTAFYNFQGDLFCVRYKTEDVGNWPNKHTIGNPHFYRCKPSSGESNSDQLTDYNFGKKNLNYINNWGYLGEDGGEHEPKIIGRNFIFEYNQQMWYFQHVHSNLYPASGNHLVDESYMCFAQIPSPANSSQEASLFYNTYNPVPDVHPMSAIQLDTLLYLISLNENSNSSNYQRWYMQEYSFNATKKKFVFIREIQIHNIPGNKFGGMISRTDSTGNPYLILNTYDEDLKLSSIGKIVPTKVDQQVQFTYTEFPGTQMNSVGASSIVQGSIQGKRSSDPNPSKSDRISWFAINNATSSDGHYHVTYRECYMYKDNLYINTTGEAIMPSNFFPKKASDEFNMTMAFETVLKDFSQDIPGKDGFQQYNWFFFPDNDVQIAGACFNSDVWRVVPGSLVSSTDLSNDNDTVYGPAIRSLWSLVGILDGAPPAVIDWHVWDSLHTFEVKPTEIIFSQQSNSAGNTSVTSSFGAQFTRGSQISMGSKKAEFEFGNSRKWSGNLESKVNLGTTIKREQTIPFDLDRETQDYGFFLWSIPQMDRYTYVVYPWWETQFQNPVPFSLQYLFRVTGMSLFTESVDLKEFPFEIPDPVAGNLQYWKSDYRQDLNLAVHSGDVKAFNVSWTNNSHGTSSLLRVGSDSTSTFTWDIEYERETTAGFKIPKVFSTEMSVGSNIKYETSSKNHTYFGTSLEASLVNMVHKSDGIKMNYLSVNVYKLKPEDQINYWFYSQLKGQKPWYITYLVSDCYDKVVTNAPLNESCLKENELVFSWQSELGTLENYTFYLTTSQSTEPASILYKEFTGDRTTCTASGFIPQQGQTYYWHVRGLSPAGDIVWSAPMKFTFACKEQQSSGESQLKALVFPNPVTANQLNITVESREAGTLQVRLLNIDGSLLATRLIDSTSGEIIQVRFSDLTLAPGIYYALIQSGSDQLVKKILIR